MERKEFLGRSLTVIAGVGLGCPCLAGGDGHVAYLFEKNVGKPPVSVDVLESVRRGGKACRFAVHV